MKSELNSAKNYHNFIYNMFQDMLGIGKGAAPAQSRNPQQQQQQLPSNR